MSCPTDEQLGHVDIFFLATTIICSLSTLNSHLIWKGKDMPLCANRMITPVA